MEVSSQRQAPTTAPRAPKSRMDIMMGALKTGASLTALAAMAACGSAFETGPSDTTQNQTTDAGTTAQGGSGGRKGTGGTPSTGGHLDGGSGGGTGGTTSTGGHLEDGGTKIDAGNGGAGGDAGNVDAGNGGGGGVTTGPGGNGGAGGIVTTGSGGKIEDAGADAAKDASDDAQADSGTPDGAADAGNDAGDAGDAAADAAADAGNDAGAVCDPKCKVPAVPECETVECVGGNCVDTVAPYGKLLKNQVAGDCQKIICDGNGGSEQSPDNNDVPVNPDQCKINKCVAGQVESSINAGAPCHVPGVGVVCDVQAKCVPKNEGFTFAETKSQTDYQAALFRETCAFMDDWSDGVKSNPVKFDTGDIAFGGMDPLSKYIVAVDCSNPNNVLNAVSLTPDMMKDKKVYRYLSPSSGPYKASDFTSFCTPDAKFQPVDLATENTYPDPTAGLTIKCKPGFPTQVFVIESD